MTHHPPPPPDPQTVTAQLPDGRRIIADLDPNTDDDHSPLRRALRNTSEHA
ncbi:hypothetical protein [Streptomyces xanthochromogenes]